MKVCSKCGVRKKNAEFSKSKRSADGKQSWCKACHNEYTANWSRRRTAKTKTCRECKRSLPLSEFHRSSATPDGHRGICKACQREYWNAWNEARTAPVPHRNIFTRAWDSIAAWATGGSV